MGSIDSKSSADSQEHSNWDQGHGLAAAEGDLFITVPTPKSKPGKQPLVRYEPGIIIGGKYQLSDLLGEGGMGWVFGAQNLTLGVPVALKLMRSDMARETHGLAERMLQEAQAAASLGHPSIIRVLDFGFTECADPYIVMEWLHGESLSRFLHRRGPLRPERAVQILLPIIDALAEAHEANIVHRDIKPENIFLSRSNGQRVLPKLLDFGIAKMTSRASGRLTREGTILGSPAYMAPEQVRGEADIDGRVDQWSLCVVLYEMITRHRPFEAENFHAEMWSILSLEPRPLAEHGLDEAELWAILQRGLSKQCNERHPDLRALWRSLSTWLNERKAPASPRAPSGKRHETPDLDVLPKPAGGRVFGLKDTQTGVATPVSVAASGARPRTLQPKRSLGLTRSNWVACAVMGILLLVLGGALGWGWREYSSVEVEAIGIEEMEAVEVAPSRAHKPRQYRAIAPLPKSGPNAPLLYVEPRPAQIEPRPPQPSPESTRRPAATPSEQVVRQSLD